MIDDPADSLPSRLLVRNPRRDPGRDRDILRLWAKAGKEATPHPLICHAVDTASVAFRLFDLLLGPTIRAELITAFGDFEGSGDRDENARRWVAVLCGLHDLGKASPAFQALRLDLAVRLHQDDPVTRSALHRAAEKWHGRRVEAPHGWLTQLHLSRALTAAGAPHSVVEAVAHGLGGHHGLIPDGSRRRATEHSIQDHGGKSWALRVDELVDRLIELCELSGWESRPWPSARIGVAGAVGLAGLASVSDWIASDSTNFEWAGTGIDLVDYAKTVDGLAAKAIDRLDWTSWTPPADTRFSALFPGTPADPTVPRPVQTAAEELLEDVTGPGLFVVEAPTGEGKTKLAFQVAAGLVRRLSLSGMYMGMPTRATGNQVFDELDDLISSHQAGLRLRLLHGAAEQYLKARGKPVESSSRQPVRPAGVGEDHPEEDLAEVRDWFAGKRGIIVPVGTGTVDQALMAAIRSRHVFVRLAGLSNKVLIIDEVHGYDVHTSTLLDRLLQWAGRLGVPVILMSATLPSVRKGELIRAWRAGRLNLPIEAVSSVEPGAAYPELTWADHAGVRTWSDADTAASHRVSELNGNRIITVDLTALAGDDVAARAEWLLDEIEKADGIAVMHNLVRRVAETRDALLRALHRRGSTRFDIDDLITITGRLTIAERAEIEARLKDRFGRGRRPARPTIVIGTQVLEQGLDLSFDLVVSDLAPIDSLVQRAGRIRRHEAHGTEPLRVRLVITGATVEPTGVELPAYTSLVYPRLLLLRTWLLLADRPDIRCPEDLRELVDRLYDDEFVLDVPEGWATTWREAGAAVARRRADDRRRSEILRLPMPHNPKAFQRLTWQPTAANQTRKKGRPDDSR
ncbi:MULTISPECIES: CRISPR-associated helicase Cas3' [Actinoalloteichus]|uniref:CRISPR-associated helicase Cas3' n=1 Tax=Actinoalloteichus TaxID=65496 RepID=UPI0018DB529A|nr:MULTISPECIES: CRISPR-associated helicase Cas3' [Actinoalloteichus]